jgi:hypothetical protein
MLESSRLFQCRERVCVYNVSDQTTQAWGLQDGDLVALARHAQVQWQSWRRQRTTSVQQAELRVMTRAISALEPQARHALVP